MNLTSLLMNILLSLANTAIQLGEATNVRSLALKSCPSSSFMFVNQWVSASYVSVESAYIPLVVGDDLTGGDIRICKTQNLGNPETLGFETLDESGNGNYFCKNRSTDAVDFSAFFRTYSVLLVPKALNVVWVKQRNFKKFGASGIKPLSVSQGDAGTVYVARCRIDMPLGTVVNLPGFLSTVKGTFTVQFNGNTMECDDDSTEFAACI